MSIDSDDGLFVLSLAARSIASHDTPEIGPLNVDVNSPPTETVAIPHAVCSVSNCSHYSCCDFGLLTCIFALFFVHFSNSFYQD